MTVNASTTLAVAGVSPAITRSTGDADPSDGPNATKTWVDLEIVLTPLTSTNPINASHTFTATVEEDLGNGAGFVPVPSGTPVNFTPDSNNTAGARHHCRHRAVASWATRPRPQPPSPSATLHTVTVLDGLNTTGSVTINASTTLAVGTALPAITRTTGDADPHDSANAVKTWISGSLSWIKDDGNGCAYCSARATFVVTETQRLRTGTPLLHRFPMPITVVDNTAPDANPVARRIRMVLNLAFGTYTIVETVPPAGYTAPIRPWTPK